MLQAAPLLDFQLVPTEARLMINTPFPRSPLPLLALTLGLSLPMMAGCGLKGDLYLPEPAAEPEQTQESLLPDDEETRP